MRRTPSISALVLLTTACAAPPRVDGEACIAERLDAQPSSRFPLGETYWLPRLTDDCGGAWSLKSAPKANTNVVVAGADGHPRFTPTIAGDYAFELGDQSIELTVVPAAGRPFHNLNYYPAGSLALVGDELWVAEVYSPTIARLDPGSLAVLGHVDVGPWPVSLAASEPLGLVAVVQRGGDTLGLIDAKTGRLVDAVWVGDEPASVRISPDGKTAYVALATEAAIAVVDLESAAVTARIATVQDPLAMAVSPDGARLYVASHRSGQPGRHPYPDDPIADERDLDIIDLATGEVVKTITDVGATITALLLDDDRLYVATVRNDTVISQVEDDSFQNTIVVLDAATGEERLAVDLDTQDSATGKAASPHQLVLAGDTLWVAVEGGDVALALDPDTLAEQRRVAVPGRPRSLVADGDAILVHGAQALSVTRVAGDELVTAATGEDPRPPAVAAGQALFTGAGAGFAEDRACNSCHADGVGDTVVWQAGPFPETFVTRPIFWLEGTPLLGWTAYVTTIDNFAFGVTSNIGRRLDTDQQIGLAAYLASLMPPPPANGKTTRDGRLSEGALRGQDLFTGKAACAACHPLPLTTTRQLLADGLTAGQADIPALVGAYRHGVWMKHGEATTLAAAVDLAVEYVGSALAKDERADLTRYLEELTARDFILLGGAPRAGDQQVAGDRPLLLTFSEPVWSDAANLANIGLRTAAGQPVPADISADGRHVTITPSSPLAPATAYEITIDAAFESLRERPLHAATSVGFTTAAAPSLRLEGAYTWTVMFPQIDIANAGFNYDQLIPAVTAVAATPTDAGATLAIDYGQGFVFTVPAVISGDTLHLPALPIAVGGSGVDGHPVAVQLVDDDDDGVADRAAGTIDFSGPGMRGEDLAWDLRRPVDPADCEEGPSGDVVVTVTPGAMTTIEWGDTPALGLYVTDPQAALPTGPGQPVTGGAVSWALQLESFPDGFLGPVTYGTVPTGAVDATETVGGEAPGAVPLASGGCYKFSVQTTDGFKTGAVTVRWP